MAFRIGKQGNPFGRKPKSSSDGVKRRAARRAGESKAQQKRDRGGK